MIPVSSSATLLNDEAMMRGTVEVQSAANFVAKRLLNDFDGDAEALKHALLKVLTRRHDGHWHPDSPERGSAFRCVSVQDGHLDPVLRDAAKMAGVQDSLVSKALPQNFTLWIDPGDVSVRIGEARIWSVDQINNIHANDSDSAGSESDDGLLGGRNLSGLNPTSKVWMPPPT
eukprot:m.69074 g.69074  ORF g.69074 m.69074 type:complete len:173 (-) comp24046_c0_seq1:47-565(-)